MKKSILLIAVLVLPFLSLFAQVPQSMKYQTVVRNSAGEPLASQLVSLRFTILEEGSNVFQETHVQTTNAFGLVNLNIGNGSGSDDLEDVNWEGASYDLQVELDPAGGTNFVLIGTSPMLAVPFALKSDNANFATTAENVLNDEVDDADADAANELQSLSINGNQLTISQGNTVTLPEGGTTAIDDEEKAKAWARVSILGNVNVTFDSYNVISASKASTGVYVVSLNSGLFSTATNPSVIATVINDLAPGVAVATYGPNPSQVTIRTYDMSGNLSDRAFSVTIFGK